MSSVAEANAQSMRLAHQTIPHSLVALFTPDRLTCEPRTATGMLESDSCMLNCLLMFDPRASSTAAERFTLESTQLEGLWSLPGGQLKHRLSLCNWLYNYLGSCNLDYGWLGLNGHVQSAFEIVHVHERKQQLASRAAGGQPLRLRLSVIMERACLPNYFSISTLVVEHGILCSNSLLESVRPWSR